ncbi:MAG: UDP-N-acetylmuramoyl-tripeptide--D-alanyl-D-alanine ligase [Lysobacteraceae bacterium]
MKPLALSQIAAWCAGRMIGGDALVNAVGTDSRAQLPDSLFVALRGGYFDGHEFHMQAAANGAVALLVSRPVDSPLPQIVVEDTQRALGRLASQLSATRSTCVAGITGSNGKTSTRTLAFSILSRFDAGAYSNPGNRNNEIGLPLAVLEQPENAKIAIYEMGAGAPGDIAYLCDIAHPRIGLVNNVAAAHLERMGSLSGVADTKAAIYDALPADGVAVVNADDAFAPYFRARASHCRVLDFGMDTSAQIAASHIVEGAQDTRFHLVSPWGTAQVILPRPGRHQISNALAAAGLAFAADASLDDVVQGLADAPQVAGRQQPHRLPNGAWLIDDSYNANPGSVAAAIDTLTARARREKAVAVLVLGDMRELGPEAAELHAHIGQRAREAGIARLFAVGELSRFAAQAFGSEALHFADQTSLSQALIPLLASNVLCLVKGSRGSRMERVVEAVLAQSRITEDSHAA